MPSRCSQTIKISESKDEWIFQLECGIRFKVSPEDVPLVVGETWHCSTKDGYIRCTSRRSGLKGQLLHVIIAKRAGLKITKDVDHRDEDRLNCRRDNLRPATRSQNKCNVGPNVNTTTGTKGVYYCMKNGKYAASIGINGKQIWLGYFTTFEEARKVREAATIKYHGEFANHG